MAQGVLERERRLEADAGAYALGARKRDDQLRGELDPLADFASRGRLRCGQQEEACLADNLFWTDFLRRIAGVGVTVRRHRLDGQDCEVQSEAEATNQIRLAPVLRSDDAR